MIFRKSILYFVTLVLIFFSFEIAEAGLVINEVELSPTAERFLEIHNTGDSSIDLTNWYIQRKTATGTTFGSLVSKTHFEGKSITAHGYFVISKNVLSNSDIVLDNLTLTESNTIQIKNADEEVIDKVGWGVSSECSGPCPDNPLEWKSIQRIGNSWVVGAPTRGGSNEIVTPPPEPATSGASAQTTSETKPKSAEVPKIKTKLTTKNISFSGIPHIFGGSATGYEGEKLFYGKFFINFGDGDSEEIPVSSGDNFSHTYAYPGDYIITLEYYSSGNIPEASHQITIKVVKPDIVISAVGDEKDFFVEITNNTNYEADISNWVLSNSISNFTFPKNTILASKKKMTLSSSLTNFTPEYKNNLKLMTPQWNVVSSYPGATTIIQKESSMSPAILTRESVEKKEDAISKSQESPLENLEAAIIQSDVVEESSFGTYFFTVSALLLIGGSAGVVYFIRQRKAITSPGSDFNILEE